jgi:hypothetical protein
MRSIFLKLSVLFVAVCVILIACKKKENKEDDPKDYSAVTSEDNALAENTFSDMHSMSDQASGGSSLSSYRPGDGNTSPSLLSSCATVTAVWGTPNVVTVDFGSNWCLCSDGRYRKGKFTVTFNGAYMDSGTVITAEATSADNYCIKYLTDTSRWVKVTGTHTVTNRGHNSSGHLSYSIHVNGTLVNNAGQTLTWMSDRTRDWIAGESTPGYWLDDKYSISGTASGTGFEGEHFTVTIDSPLIVDFTCFISAPYSCKITQGKFTLTPDGKAPRSLDYGSGACDNTAVFSVYDFTATIYVR